MKNFLSVLVAIAFVLICVKSFADVTIKKDGQGAAVGRFEIINLKTGGSGIVTSSGEILTIDETNLTGVNWQSLNALGVAGVNWTGANISYSGINWTSVKALDASFGSHSGINWTSFGV